MSDYPDWKLAPEGATHFHFGSVKYSAHWKKEGYFCVTDFESAGWREDFHPITISEYIERPQPEHKPWSGPEDGLPPIGSVCEVENPLEHGQWCKVKILAWDAECAVFQAEADYPYVYDGQGIEGFRQIRTPEQLRETAIREVMDIAQVDCRVTAARLVDAGYSRKHLTF